MAQRTSEKTVQANVDAYNAKDIDAFTETYAPDAKFCKLDGTVLLADREAITMFHHKFFEGNPSAHCAITQHISIGPFVVDHQTITVEGRPPMNVMLVSEVRDGVIVRASYSPV